MNNLNAKPTKPARIWIGTIPYSGEYAIMDKFVGNCVYAIGQQEIGESGYHHYQLVVYFGKPVRLSAVKKVFGDNSHWEPTKSDAAEQYVRKPETAVADSQFEFGKKPLNRARTTDWDQIRADAIAGRLDTIPSDVFIRSYGSLRRIASDFAKPIGMERSINVFWGSTGVGKSRRAWEEAGMEAYPKDPRTKFWDGYNGQEHVVIDEYRGGIDISHILRWFDRYPVIVEIKGSSTVLKASKIWITSNLHPSDWYPGLDVKTYDALLRRLNVEQIL